MKQENGKKSKKWLWIILAIIALLAAVGVALAIFLQPAPPDDDPVDDTPTSEVYWNIDKVKFTENSETGLSTREAGEDGLYHFRFASQGQLLEIATADKQLVNYIDTMDACGLVLDADGLIIDVLDVKEIAVETAKSFYVKAINGTSVTVNSSIAMNGMDIMFEMTDATHIMDVRRDTETLGEAVELDVMDVVFVYGSEEVPAESIFLTERPESSPLYLRVDRFYDSATASTTRVPDENGVYTIPMAINGKVEQLKCKDKNIVTSIDVGTDAKQVMGLTFDDEGYITGTILAATAVRGKIACTVYHVTAMNGNAIEATRLMTGSEEGKVVNFNLTEETQIVMGEDGCCHFIGERVPDLQMNDRIICWTDMNNNALYIYIARRQVEDIPMYYNFEKSSVDTNKETTRVPDASGYYVFKLASEGKVVTVKTKDKALASKMDADSYQFFGLKVEKGIVKAYYSKDCLTGGYGIGGTTRYVTQVMANIVQISGSGTFDSFSNYILTPDTEIYDLTQDPGTKVGAKTTLQQGDRIIAARDVLNNMTHVYVLDRYYKGCKLYYNASRKYSTTTLETTRTPDAEGYYVYTMYCEGKEVEVKTKDKALATAIDRENAPIVAMKVSNGIVKAAYPAISGIMYSTKRFNYNYVGEITSDKVVSCYYFSNGERVEASASYKMASNCQIYNVSTNFNKSRGEKATLKVGDRIQAIQNYQTGELTHIWIMSRAMNSPLYMHTNRIAPTDGITNRIPDADGYYSVDLFVDGKIKTFRTKDAELMGQVDSYGSETFFAMEVKGDIIQKVDSASASVNAVNTIVSSQDVMKISGKTITTERKRPGQSNTGATMEFTYSSKTKIYNVSYYAGEDRWKTAKLEKGDRIIAYGDREGNISYIFIMYPHLREKGYESKCSHCNKTVWWEPWTGSCITTAGDEIVHYYQPADYTRGQGTIGMNVNTATTVVPRFTAVFDLNGKTFTSTGRNFLVYYDLVVIDSVGGGVLEANGYNGGNGGNFMVTGGSVTINDGVTLRQNDVPEARASKGGNFIVGNLDITETGKTNIGKVILNDAKLEAWDCKDGGNIMLNAGTELTVKKATITGGDIAVAEGAKVKLNGSNIKISGEGIDLRSGAKIAESKLSGSSKVIVQANGIFTEKLSNANAQKAYYEAERKFYPIEVRDSALWTDRDPSKPDYVAEPEIPALPEVTSVDNSALVLNANSQAKCPVCNEVVTWTAISDASKTQALTNGHYYLANDIAYEAAHLPYIQAASGVTACLHLNDHNITATNAQAVHVNGTLSIMGNGTVSGNGFAKYELISSKRPDLHAATLEANGSAAVVNLYGGTYVKSAANDDRMADVVKSGEESNVNCANHIVEVHGNGGTINMFEGVVIDARNTKKCAVQSYWGMFNLYGGTIYGGSSNAVSAGNWTETKSGGFSIYGGTVEGTVHSGGHNSGNGPAYLHLYGGKITGNTTFNANTEVILAGNPVLTKLTQPVSKVGAYEGLIILGKLTEGAYIPITGSEAITFQNENAADYVKYFHSLTGTEIVHQNFAVAFFYVPDPELPEVPDVMPAVTEDLQFIGESTWALCPLCEEYVKWTPITQMTYGANAYSTGALPDGTHLYLAEDITYTGSSVFMYSTSGKDRSACLHLNGHNFTATNAHMVQGYTGKLNIMGSGKVSGNGKSGATFVVNTSDDFNGGIFLHSGTYTKASGNATGVAQINSNGGRIWVGPDATVTTSKGQLAAKVAGGNLTSGHLIIEGTVEGGYVESAALTPNKDGLENFVIVEVKNADLQGGAKFAADTKIALSGETKIAGLDMTSGAKLTASELSGAAAVTVKANGAFTERLSNANAQLPFYTAITGYYPVEVKDGALWTADDPEVDEEKEIVFPVIPEKPATPAVTSVDNSNLVLDANNQAKCPVCGEVVTWTALTSAGAERIELAGDIHYYLAEDFVYTGTDTAIALSYNSAYKGMTTCLHLNGHNVTAEQGIGIFAGMHLNIMGNGTVSGNSTKSNRAATLEVNSTAAILNVYGGTYVKPADNANPIVAMNTAGGVLNIFDPVVIGNADFSGKGNVVRNFNGTINVWGGTIWGGENGNCIQAMSGKSGANTVYGTVNICGGLIQAKSGGSANVSSGASLNIYGGKFGGTASVNVDAKVSVSGNPVMNRVQVAEGAKLVVGELTEGASIAVRANGVFTEPCENADAYVEKGYIVPFNGYKDITVVDYALFTEEGTDEGGTTTPEPEPEPEPDIPADPATPALPAITKVDNAALVTDTTNVAKCPVCDKEVTWIAITDASAVQTLVGGNHYMLDADLTFEGEAVAYLQAADSTAACLHLNDHNITATKSMVAYVTGKLNIMGNGTLSGNGVTTTVDTSYAKHRGGTIEVNKKDAVLNVYGGTYIKAADNATHVIANVFGNGGELNIFEGATFDARNTAQQAVRSFTGVVNVYGGTVYGGSNACVATSNWTNSRADGSGNVNIYGGEILAGSGTAVSGAGTEKARGSVGIYGGKISGGCSFSNLNCDVVIGGNPVMTHLTVGAGNKITLGQLTEGASIAVRATDVFTNPSANAETYLKYFTARDSGKAVTVVDNALSYGDAATTPEPEPEPEPVAFDNSDLVFEEGTNKAKCPLCGEVVEWIALTQEANGATATAVTAADQHYYLAEDITYTGTDHFITGPGSNRKLCIHLNGHNFTSTQARFLFGYASKSNVMGNGIVASGHNKANEGGVAWNTNNQGDVSIDLYGGTYTVTAGNDKGSPIAIQNNGGVITVHEGATVIGSATAPAIYVGTSNLRTSALTVKGAQIEGNIEIKALNTAKGFSTTVVLEDAKVSAVKLGKDVSFTVSGDTVIGKMEVEEGAKLTVGELGSAAKIDVIGNGVISEANDKMSAYLGNFTSSYGYQLSVVDKALVATNNAKVINNADLALTEGKALCPVCNKTVEWTAISEIKETLYLVGEGHYYLANDITYEASSNAAISYLYDAAKKDACLHLNGHNLTATNERAIFAGNHLNVMGNGIVSGNFAAANRGATVESNSSATILNLYGGTYVKAAENTMSPIVLVNTAGGVINMFEGATIDGTGLSTEANAGCVVLRGRVKTDTATAIVAQLNIYGGTIKNGTNTTGHGGNIRLTDNAKLNMYGGTVSGGKAPANYGGNIYSSAGSVNIHGGTVSDGLARIGGNIATSGHSLSVKNATVKNGIADLTSTGTASHGGNVSVDKATLYIGVGAQILNGSAPKGHAGNVRCYNTVLTMDGGLVSGGTSKYNNGNIWVYCDQEDSAGKALQMDAYFNGGLSVTASGELVTTAGNGLAVSNNINAHLSGGFSVVDPEGAAFPGTTVASSASIVEEDGWFGSLNK